MGRCAVIICCWLVGAAAIALLVCHELFKENFYVKTILPCLGIALIVFTFHGVLSLLVTREANIEKNIANFGKYAVDIRKAIVTELTQMSLQNKLDGVDLK